MTQPPLTHPATNPDGTCDDQNCPCHEFTRMPTATTTNDDDTISDCEPETPKINYSEYMRTFKYPPPQPPETIKVVIRAATSDDWIGVAYQKDYTGDPSTIHEYRLAERESPALRNTRSIVHHAEMVEEQVRRERGLCLKCGHNSIGVNGRCRETIPNLGEHRDTVKWRACNCKCVFLDQTALHGLREALKDNNHALFSDAWDFAPADIRRVTEQECAEFFYELGRRDERRLLAETTNEDLCELQRVARERLR